MAGFTGASPIVTDGLIFAVDAANYESYTSGSDTWNNIIDTTTSASIENGVSYTSNYAGGFLFDGTDDYMNVNSTQNIFNQTWSNGLTIQTIISVPTDMRIASDGMCLLVRSNGGADTNSFNWSLQTKGSTSHADYRKLRFWIASYQPLFSNTRLTDTKPYICTLTYDRTVSPTSVKIYINGQLDNSTTVTATPTTATRNIFIGSGGTAFSGWEFDGTIYSINCYNKALTSQEVLQNYNALKSRFNL